VVLCWKERLGNKSNWMPSVKCIGLFQNGPHSEITSISDESEWSGVVREGQNRGCDESSDEGSEGSFCRGILDKWGILLCKVEQGSDNGGIILDKPSVEVTEA